jgi:hypothetical protein
MPLAAWVKHVLGLPNTLHPNTCASALLFVILLARLVASK